MNKISFAAGIIVLALLPSCFKKDNHFDIKLDFDLQKLIDKNNKTILFSPTATSGKYVSYCDSLSPYSFSLNADLFQFTNGFSFKKFKLEAMITRETESSLGSIDFKIVNERNEPSFTNNIFISKETVPELNKWTKVEGEIVLPEDKNLYSRSNSIYLFMYGVNGKIFIDDLIISPLE